MLTNGEKVVGVKTGRTGGHKSVSVIAIDTTHLNSPANALIVGQQSTPPAGLPPAPPTPSIAQISKSSVTADCPIGFPCGCWGGYGVLHVWKDTWLGRGYDYVQSRGWCGNYYWITAITARGDNGWGSRLECWATPWCWLSYQYTGHAGDDAAGGLGSFSWRRQDRGQMYYSDGSGTSRNFYPHINAYAYAYGDISVVDWEAP